MPGCLIPSPLNRIARSRLLGAGPREDVIPKTNIKERRTSPKSVMPERFEQILKDDEFRDLIRYVLEAPVGKN